MTKQLLEKCLKLRRSKKGQSMVEYVFILGFIALAVILSLTQLGTALGTKFTEFAEIINR